MVTKEQVKIEIDSLENTQILEQIYKMIQGFKESSTSAKTVKKLSKEELQKTLDAFCGMHEDLDIHAVEDELRLIRKGRRRLWDDI
jgi:hypothetical protein